LEPEQIHTLVAALDTQRSSEEATAWRKLVSLGAKVVPFLAEAYPQFRTWQGRASLLHHAIKFARAEDVAFELGLSALRDKSHVVRYRACMAVAYSLRYAAIPQLEVLLSSGDPRTVADARAAIDAIRHQNHHLFIDREHSGKIFWNIPPVEPAA
jgi:hypothetical protein